MLFVGHCYFLQSLEPVRREIAKESSRSPKIEQKITESEVNSYQKQLIIMLKKVS